MNEKVGTYYNDVISAINNAADFSLQEDWDNSGGLVPSSRRITKILTALDITLEVAREAANIGAELVVSHHPVIFKGLKKLDPNQPAVTLVKNDIGAICAHTNADIAEDGLNDFLCATLGLAPQKGVVLCERENIGRICTLEKPLAAAELAGLIKKKLGCHVVRCTDNGRLIHRVGICSGSGGDLMAEAAAKGCQALVTGDVKHNFFVEAKNCGFCLFDAGHFHTEVIFNDYIAKILRNAFPDVEIVRAKSDNDPCVYY